MAESMLGEFESPHALARAIVELRAQGYRDLDAHTPYSTERVRQALGEGRSRLPGVVLLAGLGGAGAAYGLQYLLVAQLYPLNVGGRPAHFPLAFIPITFEMGVLAAALAAFFGALTAGRLVKLWDPVFEAEGFESASIDHFWVRVGGADPRFNRDELEQSLRELGARRVRRVEHP